MNTVIRVITENMRRFFILQTPIHSYIFSLTCKTLFYDNKTRDDARQDTICAETSDFISDASPSPDKPTIPASNPEFFANYAVGTSVYNKSRPEESYIIYQLFIKSDDVEGPYVIALLTANKNGSPWLRQGTMRMAKLASGDNQLFVPFNK